MTWDDELEGLSMQVVERLGREALDAAIYRAISMTPKQFLDAAMGVHAGPSGHFEGALRAELRRCLTPH
jgi:hypothetical protein